MTVLPSVRLAKLDPGNASWQYDLGVRYNRIGDLLMAQHNLAAALNSYEAKKDIISRLAKADPGNAAARSRGIIRENCRCP